MEDNKPQIEALEITFEAFGKTHKCYLPQNEIGSAAQLIQKVCPTAFIVEGIIKEVTIELYEENNITKIATWVQNIKDICDE